MHALRLFEDRLAPRAHYGLPAWPRVLYTRDGGVAIVSPGGPAALGAGAAWHGAGACAVTAGTQGATVLRFELGAVAGTSSGGPSPGVTTALLLTHPIALDPAQSYLMRCDRVEFAPGGEALPHGHQGGGIRCLLTGELEVRVGDRPGRRMTPGEAWFESGAEPVHAIASPSEATAFIRVAILPRAIQGQSSIVYVDPAHAAVKPRTYSVYVDEPIDLGEPR